MIFARRLFVTRASSPCRARTRTFEPKAQSTIALARVSRRSLANAIVSRCANAGVPARTGWKPVLRVALTLLCLHCCMACADEPPTEWIDADTGHRVVRLSKEPGSASLYFHQNAYTPDG